MSGGGSAFVDFGSHNLRCNSFRIFPLRSCLGLVRWVLVCMCVHYVFVGVLGVGLSMGVALGLAPTFTVYSTF